MHPSRSLHPPAAHPAQQQGQQPTPTQRPGLARPPPPLRIPSSPARAQTHRILSAGTQAPANSFFASAAANAINSANSTREAAADTPPPRVNHSTVTAGASTAAPTTGTSYPMPLPSPCFVHSHLDPTLNASAAGNATIKAKKKARARPAELAYDAIAARRTSESASETTPTRTTDEPAPMLGGGQGQQQFQVGNDEAGAAADEDDYATEGDEVDTEDERNTWTRQLAETAVSVREMSRQLGQSLRQTGPDLAPDAKLSDH